MPSDLDALARKLDAFVASDNTFQRRARVLQALWREKNGLKMGTRPSGERLGSRIDEAAAAEYRNLMTPAAQRAVRNELATQGEGKLIERTRLFSNLLSSQPLCFNLFGELQADLQLATAVARELWPTRVASVTAVRFEHSPGRGDLAFTGDNSAFDVFFEHRTPEDKLGFIGIEVKYHEDLGVKEADHKDRYDEVAAKMGCFRKEKLDSLALRPLEQIWRDHLLLGSMLEDSATWSTGLYVFLYPQDNEPCARAAAEYRACLTPGATTFEALTLERLLDVIERHASGTWARDVRDRYLGWEKLEREP